MLVIIFKNWPDDFKLNAILEIANIDDFLASESDIINVVEDELVDMGLMESDQLVIVLPSILMLF